MMACDVCGSKLASRKATSKEPYLYQESGLSNVSLIGIVVHACDRCGVEVPLIPRAGELNRLIARCLMEKADKLNGPEIKFLRKFSGKSAKQFAGLIRLDPSTLCRAEAGTQDLGPSVDQLVRAVASVSKDMKEARKVLLQEPEGGEHWQQVVFEPSTSGWTKKAA